LLGKVKEQQQTTLQQQQINQQLRRAHNEQQEAVDELVGSHGEVKHELEELSGAHEELKVAHERLKLLVGTGEIVLRVSHAELTGREAFVPLYANHPTRIYSEHATVQGHTVSIFVQTKNAKPDDQDYCGLFLDVAGGPFPCKATYTFELVHHDGNPQSAVKDAGEYTFSEAYCWGFCRLISKARLASPVNNPYVKDGYVTFKCTFKIVDGNA
jgi:hypothetical protein